MSDNNSLFNKWDDEPEKTNGKSNTDGGRYSHFKEFHKNNPRVFELFEQFARTAKTRGSRRCFGARMIGERIRWYTAVETDSDDEYRINDHHWPYYARLLMLRYPEFDGYFERRDSHFDVEDKQLLEECA